MQDQTIDKNWLYAQGWTIRQAARKLGRSPQHIAEVLKGTRRSEPLLRKIKKLPLRSLSWREHITH